MDVSPRQNPAYRPSLRMGIGVIRRRHLWIAALVVYAGAIFAGSSLPLRADPTRFPLARIDGLLHAAEFVVFFLLARKAIGSTAGALLASALYAGSDELHQAFVPGRSATLVDAAFDVAGAAAAALVRAGVARSRLLARMHRRILAIRGGREERDR